ncbi:GrpB family protein [Curtobacterium sp. ISL-83]|uniref:GrpB family protein n=1 Tax=Curtobacterium sp. ISL-83 TaxID=2819145 RepID=UPI001BECEBAC|nr:GrpB family protein [Curtobacterium sp. ISL-83]MBT2504231.1 GrpB family protein [Curtobacterium sp. ISL-83]
MIEVVEYQPSWSARFSELRAAYGPALRAAGVGYRSIEHVGSTSVPGLAAKPIIDVDVVVEAADAEPASRALAHIGFEARGDLDVPGRIAFFTPERFAPSNTYVMTDGSLALRNHLAVRDVLRADSALRDEYAAAKRQAAISAGNPGEYLVLKSGVLDRILCLAGLSAEERAQVAEVNRSIAARGVKGD